jgi:hypothetical protein
MFEDEELLVQTLQVGRHNYSGWEDSNSEMSSQNIPLKGRTDFR